MAEIVNLNKVRKSKARLEAGRTAETNRILHGRTKAEKTADRREAEKAAKELDGKKVDE
jgi:ribosomal protein S2